MVTTRSDAVLRCDLVSYDVVMREVPWPWDMGCESWSQKTGVAGLRSAACKLRDRIRS